MVPAPHPQGARWWRVVVLRIYAVTALFALTGVLMPSDWMAKVHRAIGLGEFPDRPIVLYLIRTLSALYFAHGIMTLIISADPHRYSPLITCTGWVMIVFGIFVAIVDVQLGLPVFWTVLEGPPLVLCGLLILNLHRRCRD